MNEDPLPERKSPAPHPEGTSTNKSLNVEHFDPSVMAKIAENFKKSTPGIHFAITTVLSNMDTHCKQLKSGKGTNHNKRELSSKLDLLGEYTPYVPQEHRDAYSAALAGYQATLVSGYEIDKLDATPASRIVCDPYIAIEKLGDVADQLRHGESLRDQIYQAKSELVALINAQYNMASMVSGQGKREMIRLYNTLRECGENIPAQYSEEYNAALATLKASLEARYRKLQPVREIVVETARQWTGFVRDTITQTFAGR